MLGAHLATGRHSETLSVEGWLQQKAAGSPVRQAHAGQGAEIVAEMVVTAVHCLYANLPARSGRRTIAGRY